ncbi:unnamed protein product [Phyllotreta striolata]|uniref:Uncharacterized protein n=1 Tax=Phyllotreta striolata TaxID=444603 RepID=A0A9N9XIP3_PHYSR|nr:unnamed protein product [Phyllotreta striolata]
MSGVFIRELDIELINDEAKTLELHQKIEGDVSCVVWDASITLAKYLENLNKKRPGCLQNMNVVELGAGVGCVGITAACLGANVLVTDLDRALPLLILNTEVNKAQWKDYGAIEVKSLNWGEDLEMKDLPNLILLADCIYYNESINPLIKTLKELSNADTEIIVCQEMRDTEKQLECWKNFTKIAKEHFEFSFIPIEEHHPIYCSSDVVLLRLKKL